MEASATEMESPPEQKLTVQSDNEADVPNNRRQQLMIGAIRMAGFLFWANIAALLSLSVGCFAPGWLTVGNSDYSLWHVTRCDNTLAYSQGGLYSLHKFRPCSTLSYRLINAISVGTKIHEDLEYKDVAQAEAMYCAGMLFSFITLCGWYKFRSKVAGNKCVDLSKKKWVLYFILATLSAILIFVPVSMFSKQRSSFSSPFSGIYFAGFGGAIMSLIAAFILSHLLCPLSPNYDICLCSTLNEPLVQAPRNV